MISGKQKAKTVSIILILAALIVAGVFAVSYYKNGYTKPWVAQSEAPKEAPQEVELTIVEKEPEPVAEEPKAEEKKEEPKPVEEAKAEEPKQAEVEAEEETVELASLSNHCEYFGALQVVDGALCDISGNPVKLMGLSTNNISWFPEFASKETVAYLKNTLGINVLRLSMFTSDYNGYCVGGADVQNALKDTIDEAVLAATENDMYVILDWHIYNDSNPNEYKSEAIQFFGEMVRRYKNHENVIYEICNEPSGDTTWADIKHYANEVIPVIRGVDADAVILVGTPENCLDILSPAQDPLAFDNIMYTYHFYADTHRSKYRNALTEAVENQVPVFVTEFGLTDPKGLCEIDEKETEKWFEMLEEYGLCICAGNFSNKEEDPTALVNSEVTKTLDFTYDDFTEQGQYIYDYLNGSSKLGGNTNDN